MLDWAKAIISIECYEQIVEISNSNDHKLAEQWLTKTKNISNWSTQRAPCIKCARAARAPQTPVVNKHITSSRSDFNSGWFWHSRDLRPKLAYKFQYQSFFRKLDQPWLSKWIFAFVSLPHKTRPNLTQGLTLTSLGRFAASRSEGPARAGRPDSVWQLYP